MDLVARLTARCTALEKDRQIAADREQALKEQLNVQASKHELLLREVESSRDRAQGQLNSLQNEYFECRQRERELKAENERVKIECADLQRLCMELRSKSKETERMVNGNLKSERIETRKVDSEGSTQRNIPTQISTSTQSNTPTQTINSTQSNIPTQISTSTQSNILTQTMTYAQSSPKRISCPSPEAAHRSLLQQNALLIEQIRSLESANAQLQQTTSTLSQTPPASEKPIAPLETGTISELKQLRRLQETINTLQTELSSSSIHVLHLFPEGEPPPRHITHIGHSPSANAEVAALEKRLERFKQVFKQKIKEFREVVLMLLGWQIDLLPDGGCRILSLYAFGREDYLTFKRDLHTGQMLLLEDEGEFVQKQFRNEREVYVKMGNSMPAFLAFVTNALWERSTVA